MWGARYRRGGNRQTCIQFLRNNRNLFKKNDGLQCAHLILQAPLELSGLAVTQGGGGGWQRVFLGFHAASVDKSMRMIYYSCKVTLLKSRCEHKRDERLDLNAECLLLWHY